MFIEAERVTWSFDRGVLFFYLSVEYMANAALSKSGRSNLKNRMQPAKSYKESFGQDKIFDFGMIQTIKRVKLRLDVNPPFSNIFFWFYF